MWWKGERKRMAFMSDPIKAILMVRSPVEGQVKRRLAKSIGDVAALILYLMLYRWMGQWQLGGFHLAGQSKFDSLPVALAIG